MQDAECWMQATTHMNAVRSIRWRRLVFCLHSAFCILHSGATAQTQQLIDRVLQLNDVARFPPPEPPAAAVTEEVAWMKMRSGPGLNELMTSTGLDEARLQLLARETLRTRAYIAQRFGTTVQVTEDEARKY